MLSCGGRSRSRSLHGLTQSRNLRGSPEGVSSPGLPRYWCLCLLITLKSSETEAGTGSATHQQHSSSLSSHLCQERAPSLAGLLLRIPGAAKHASHPPKPTERTGGSSRTKPLRVLHRWPRASRLNLQHQTAAVCWEPCGMRSHCSHLTPQQSYMDDSSTEQQ